MPQNVVALPEHQTPTHLDMKRITRTGTELLFFFKPILGNTLPETCRQATRKRGCLRYGYVQPPHTRSAPSPRLKELQASTPQILNQEWERCQPKINRVCKLSSERRTKEERGRKRLAGCLTRGGQIYVYLVALDWNPTNLPDPRPGPTVFLEANI
jgi:hypothetical protein